MYHRRREGSSSTSYHHRKSPKFLIVASYADAGRLSVQVWQLRLTLHFLADAGNLLDCASLAAMTALRHFRKPEVEVTGGEVIFVSPLIEPYLS